MTTHKCHRCGDEFADDVTKHAESPGANIGSGDDVPWLCKACNASAREG